MRIISYANSKLWTKIKLNELSNSLVVILYLECIVAIIYAILDIVVKIVLLLECNRCSLNVGIPKVLTVFHEASTYSSSQRSSLVSAALSSL